MEKPLTHVAVRFKCNWADEFNVVGVWLGDREEYEEMRKEWEEQSYPWEKYFGTNQSIEFRSVKDFLSKCTIHQITEEEYTTLTRVLGSRWFGANIEPRSY